VYHIAVYFDVQPEHRDEFIAAALEDGRNSGADEPGTQRFELIVDEENPNRFYLNEGYADAAAFEEHANGPHFARFFEFVNGYADGPTWLIRGNRVEDQVDEKRTAKKETLTLIAGFQAKPGQETRLREALSAMIEPSEAEPGCLSYRPLDDPIRPGAMICLEEWEDEAALQFHFGTSHFKNVAAVLDEILAEPFTLRRLTSVSEAD
jgi:(4S)-4-hydroxy-5-phosphonooxypentane-2,3-dione isomerase